MYTALFQRQRWGKQLCFILLIRWRTNLYKRCNGKECIYIQFNQYFNTLLLIKATDYPNLLNFWFHCFLVIIVNFSISRQKKSRFLKKFSPAKSDLLSTKWQLVPSIEQKFQKFRLSEAEIYHEGLLLPSQKMFWRWLPVFWVSGVEKTKSDVECNRIGGGGCGL